MFEPPKQSSISDLMHMRGSIHSERPLLLQDRQLPPLQACGMAPHARTRHSISNQSAGRKFCVAVNLVLGHSLVVIRTLASPLVAATAFASLYWQWDAIGAGIPVMAPR